jgi:hypothetical protein
LRRRLAGITDQGTGSYREVFPTSSSSTSARFASFWIPSFLHLNSCQVGRTPLFISTETAKFRLKADMRLRVLMVVWRLPVINGKAGFLARFLDTTRPWFLLGWSWVRMHLLSIKKLGYQKCIRGFHFGCTLSMRSNVVKLRGRDISLRSLLSLTRNFFLVH